MAGQYEVHMCTLPMRHACLLACLRAVLCCAVLRHPTHLFDGLRTCILLTILLFTTCLQHTSIAHAISSCHPALHSSASFLTPPAVSRYLRARSTVVCVRRVRVGEQIIVSARPFAHLQQ